MGRIQRGAFLCPLFVCIACGCGTLGDHGFGPCPQPRTPRIYGGVREDLDGITSDSVEAQVFCTLDLPLSAVADTVLLPATIQTLRSKQGQAAGAEESK